MGLEVQRPGGTMKSRLLKKFKPTLGMPDLRERYLRPGGMADGGVADAVATANSKPNSVTPVTPGENPNTQQNTGSNPTAGGPTADSAAASSPVYPTPPSSGGAQNDINSGPLALQPMNLTQAPRVAKGGAIKMKTGGRVKAHVNVKVPTLNLKKPSSGIKPIKGMKSGGAVRGCGIAIKGKTKGRMV